MDKEENVVDISHDIDKTDYDCSSLKRNVEEEVIFLHETSDVISRNMGKEGNLEREKVHSSKRTIDEMGEDANDAGGRKRNKVKQYQEQDIFYCVPQYNEYLDDSIKDIANQLPMKNTNTEDEGETVSEFTQIKFDCKLCPKKFRKLSSLSKHIKSIHEGLSFSCDKCPYKTAESEHLSQHAKTEHDINHSVEVNTDVTNIDTKKNEKIINLIEDDANRTSAGYMFESNLETQNKPELKTNKKNLNIMNKESIHEGLSFSCDKCPYATTLSEHLIQHTKTEHEINPLLEMDTDVTILDPKKNEKVINFDEDDEVRTSTGHTLENNLATKNKTEIKKRKKNINITNKESINEDFHFPCDKCPYSTTLSEHLIQHAKTEHEINPSLEMDTDVTILDTKKNKKLINFNEDNKTRASTGHTLENDLATENKTEIKSRKANINITNKESINEGLHFSCNKCIYSTTLSDHLIQHAKNEHEINPSLETDTDVTILDTKKNKKLINFNENNKIKVSTGHTLENDLATENKTEIKARKANINITNKESIHEGLRFSCDKCPYSTTLSEHLIQHAKMEHNINPSETDDYIRTFTVPMLENNLLTQNETESQKEKKTLNLTDKELAKDSNDNIGSKINKMEPFVINEVSYEQKDITERNLKYGYESGDINEIQHNETNSLEQKVNNTGDLYKNINNILSRFPAQNSNTEESTHVKSVHEVHNFSCDECFFTTTQSESLIHHENTNHDKGKSFLKDGLDKVVDINEPISKTENLNLSIEAADVTESKQLIEATERESTKETIVEQIDSLGPSINNEIEEKDASKIENVDKNEENANQKVNLKEEIIPINSTNTKKDEENVKEPTDNNPMCGQCNTKFIKPESLSRHVKSVHEGLTFSCDQCHYTATQRGSLIRHIRSVHDKIRYSCNLCGYSATQKPILNKHLKMKH